MCAGKMRKMGSGFAFDQRFVRECVGVLPDSIHGPKVLGKLADAIMRFLFSSRVGVRANKIMRSKMFRWPNINGVKRLNNMHVKMRWRRRCLAAAKASRRGVC